MVTTNAKAEKPASVSTTRSLRVGIELTGYRRQASGSEVYMRNLVENLTRLAHRHRFFLFVNFQDAPYFKDILPANCTVISTALRWRPTRTFSHQILSPIWTRLLNLDLFHSTTFVIPFLCRSVPQVLTVHDMTFFTLPAEIRPPSDALFRRAVLASLRRASRVLVPSEATRNLITTLIPDMEEQRIALVPLGVGHEFSPQAAVQAPAVLSKYQLPSRYILFVGTLEPRKNLVRLVQAFDRLSTHNSTGDLHLVLAGQMGWNSEELQTVIKASPARERIHVPGYVDQKDLPALYGGASLFVYPSIEEGFGLPPLEAMSCGVPTISSNLSSMAEFLLFGAELVDPYDVNALTLAMQRVLTDQKAGNSLTHRGIQCAARFRWETVAARTLGVYEDLFSETAP